ncbi:MAG: type I-C CRISPR-associated endonuclease Cas1c [Bacteroidales bacterium]
MRKLLNTLYVTTPEAYLSKDGENIVIKIKDEERFRIPALNIEGIVSFSYMGASPQLIKMCTEYNIGLSFLSPSGDFLGRVSGKIRGNVLLRRIQYRIADDKERSLQISSIFISGKIANMRSIIERYKRDYCKDDDCLVQISQHLKTCKRHAFHASDSDSLRGIEGDAANCYFSVFNRMIIHQKNIFSFNGRNRRPPKDKVNALLSFLYTLLAHDVQSALETVGLDPFVGFMHTDRPGRPSLALDMMEEFRSYLCDRLVLSLINRKQINERDFIVQGNEGVIMSDNGRKTVIQAWQNRKQEEIIHPYLKEKVKIGLLPYIQAVLLARYLRGELDNYAVFLIQ